MILANPLVYDFVRLTFAQTLLLHFEGESVFFFFEFQANTQLFHKDFLS